MQRDHVEQPAPAGAPSRQLVPVLAVLGISSAAVPDAGRALGVDVPVARSVEIVDHVVPGVAVLAAALVIWTCARSPAARLAAWATVLLAGLWTTVSHAALVADAGRGVVGWSDALFHAAIGVPILAIGLWGFAALVRDA